MSTFALLQSILKKQSCIILTHRPGHSKPVLVKRYELNCQAVVSSFIRYAAGLPHTGRIAPAIARGGDIYMEVLAGKMWREVQATTSDW